MTTPAADREAPEESRWGFEEGEEIVPGLSAIKLLGGGYRYEAYLSWDDRLRYLVVAKVLRPGLIDDAHTLEGLAAEAQMLERLSHPVLVRGFGGEPGGPRPHVVLEHLEGPRLSSLLRRYGPLPPEQLVPLGLQLLSVVHYLAAEEVVHLDIKPSNVIMAAPPRLIDLSVARTVEECVDLRSPVGTDAYMAPEQCAPLSGTPIGPAADMWGVGVTLYRSLTGDRPYPKGNPDAEVPEERWPQLSVEPEPLNQTGGGAIDESIMSCLQRNPSDRPTPAEVAERIEGVLETLPKPRISKLKPRIARRRR